jgi:hypothetical protein
LLCHFRRRRATPALRVSVLRPPNRYRPFFVPVMGGSWRVAGLSEMPALKFPDMDLYTTAIVQIE